MTGSLGSTAHARVFGVNTRDSFASYDPATSSWRTSQLSLDGGLTVFSETWPRAGMTRSGTASRLRPLAPLTDATGSGSLGIPTPTVGDSKSARNSTAVRHKIPPTGIHAGDTLTDYVTKWPTPTARDGRTLKGAQDRKREGGPSLAQSMLNDGHKAGSLNPTWVEWLMGFPLGWTDCGVSETRSSRRSRSGSAGESSSGKASK